MLLHATQIRKLFAGDVVLDGAELRMERGEKIALVGRNGAGKTTLLKILTEEYEPDGGTVQWSQGVTVGYLSQHTTLDPTKTVLQEAESAREHLVEIEKRIKELEVLLEKNPSPEDLEEYSLLQEHFQTEGGYSVERDLTVVLNRMGFEENEFSKPVGKLSGGERTRLVLAKLLLEEPELLILDEPTNHLDLDATEWLEGWIREYHGAVLLVSHDRIFLQNVAQRVVEVREQKAFSYKGSFEKFMTLRQEENERLAVLAAKQAGEIEKTDEFVRRFMNSQRTAQARGRQKHLEKMKAEAVEAPKAERQMHGGFKDLKRSGDLVIETKDLGKSFGDQVLFQHLDWTVQIGERWGVIGQNGTGKSTLMRMLLGRIEPTSGTYRIGSSVYPGYFAQDAEDFDPDQSPVMFLNYELGMEIGPARNLLARFLISGDDSLRPIRTLSGGERNKLQLAVLTAQSPNLLILDEPTNHLDMPSREALAEVLKDYKGTLILVSHDRWLLNQITNRTLDLRHGGESIQFEGGYTEYRSSRLAKVKPGNARPGSMPTKAALEPTMSPRELSKEIGKCEKSVFEAEAKVASTEAALAELEQQMANPGPGVDVVALTHRYGAITKEVAAALATWEAEAARLEELQAMRR